jgi:hypothetical protein
VSVGAKRWVALGLVAVGGLLAVLALTHTGSVRGYVREHYRYAGARGAQQLYRSDRPALPTAAAIEHAFTPSDRRATPEGVFLRYRKDMVAVTPSGRGSQVSVVPEREGYRLFYPYVGGFWGTYSGPAETFRGGGPGGGGK